MIKPCPLPEPFFSRFERLRIRALNYSHPPVFTVTEGLPFKGDIPGGHTKNLFLKDKKDQIFLVTALQDTVINLKALHEPLGSGRLSFGSPGLLQDVLGVIPGAVTPLALCNDMRRRVIPVLDRRLLSCRLVNCHPLRNDMTTGLTPQDLVLYLTDMGYRPVVIDFSGQQPILCTEGIL